MDDIVIEKFPKRGGNTQGNVFDLRNGEATSVGARFHMGLQIAALGELRNESDILFVSDEIENLKNVGHGGSHQFVVYAHFALQRLLVRRFSPDSLQEDALPGFAVP